MEKTLILKHISEMLCLLISYSKFTRPTEKDIREAIADPDPEINKLTGEPIKPEEKPKPIRLSGELRAKYFTDTDPKEVEGIADKALAAWFKKRR